VSLEPKPISAELRRCFSFKECISAGLDKACTSGEASTESRRQRFSRLVAVLQNMNAGKSGGGLSGAQATESIWKELLKDIDEGGGQFAFEPKRADADFSHRGEPFSLKTLGFRNKNADLALAWSKNKPGSKQRKFESAMVILSFRPAAPKSKNKFWRTSQQGIYIIPLSRLCARVRRFNRNNKTDTLIKAKYVVKLMESAVADNLFLSLEISPSLWTNYELSFWKGGKACLIQKSSRT
jgi:hypothetical protein